MKYGRFILLKIHELCMVGGFHQTEMKRTEAVLSSSAATLASVAIWQQIISVAAGVCVCVPLLLLLLLMVARG